MVSDVDFRRLLPVCCPGRRAPSHAGASGRLRKTMIDRHYGHLARDGRDHATRLLDELSAGQRPRWTLVDAVWTPTLADAAIQDNESIG
jgi:hypothetical protein